MAEPLAVSNPAYRKFIPKTANKSGTITSRGSRIMPSRLIMTATKMDAIIIAPIIMTILAELAEAAQAEEAAVHAEAN